MRVWFSRFFSAMYVSRSVWIDAVFSSWKATRTDDRAWFASDVISLRVDENSHRCCASAVLRSIPSSRNFVRRAICASSAVARSVAWSRSDGISVCRSLVYAPICFILSERKRSSPRVGVPMVFDMRRISPKRLTGIRSDADCHSERFVPRAVAVAPICSIVASSRSLMVSLVLQKPIWKTPVVSRMPSKKKSEFCMKFLTLLWKAIVSNGWSERRVFPMRIE